ncbi:MAG: 2-C-methyl-D-erythritol 4-phosphate cytidylyltransferase [Planctomycetota bacterium]|nr:2-C-methyl-D-erythritol 4-phosphate cytidylyltransferase [Planctomycetota bacterium]
MSEMKIAVILPAAGSSKRFSDAGAMRSKLDEDMGGKPVLQRTVEAFNKHDKVSQIIVAGPADDAAMAEFRERHADRLGLLGAKLVKGGADHRYETVRAALAHVSDCTHVAVHDAARPCITMELMDRIFDAAAVHDAVIPVMPVPDTIKRVRTTQERLTKPDQIAAILGISDEQLPLLREVEATIDRTRLYLVQTPQVFSLELIRQAYDQNDLTSTDDASLVERMGHRVVAVEGDARNIKITYPADADLARAIMGWRSAEGRASHKKF